MDFLYLGVIVLAFAATYGLLKVCEWLSHDTHARLLDGQGEHS
jgi:hypothetical protein